MKRLTFETVCKQLKEDEKFSEIVEDINVLSGVAILLLGSNGIIDSMEICLNTLTIKDELVSVGKRILEKIVKCKKENDEYEKRVYLMKWAYTMIHFTSFFDVLDEKMPKEIRDKLNLSMKEKQYIFHEVVLEKQKKNEPKNEIDIYFPNVLSENEKVESRIIDLYKKMCVGLKRFIDMLSFAEKSDEETSLVLNSLIEEMPGLALKRFKAQYLYLASNFNEFYIYMQIEDSINKEKYIDELYKKIISLGCNTEQKIDVGLERLENILGSLPQMVYEGKIKNIVDSLIENYRRAIEKPIIESKDENEKLQYPSIDKAFIPQSYKILQYSGEEKLEKKSTWSDKDIHDQMDSFWAKYLLSPYSIENLLLILGEPGGGKSLLTQILCARMINKNNIFVRIPLREVSVEKEIEEIVCEQIQEDGDASEPIPTFKWFADNFKANPITLIFDGYDEVLQATGSVHRSLLRKILRFQNQCLEKHRPIRVIVTSRETLIDKAEIPKGSTVLKLLEFDEQQRQEWINIWNAINMPVFKSGNIEPFILPESNKSIDELSRQPLLLLMLAIYDANLEEGVNSLGKKEMLNRTKLYDELLRRFIRRELKKGARGNEVFYEEASDDEQDSMIEHEMDKLGTAALGMFIRGKLSLNVSELKTDLVNMEIKMPEYEKVGKMLEEGEILFGSFFFVHDSKSGGAKEDREEAFEFLHKTFYEFLVANLILKYLIMEIDELNELRKLRARTKYEKAIAESGNLGKQYCISLMYTCLCVEPAIIQMMNEWKEELVCIFFHGDRFEFDITIEELFNKQIEKVEKNYLMMSVWQDSLNSDCFKKSYFEYCAIYLFNLLIIQTITKLEQRSEIDEKIWRIISQFWKMNIPEGVILKFTQLFCINKKDNERISIEKRKIISKIEKDNKLINQLEISDFLQDETTHKLYLLHDMRVQSEEKQVIRRELHKQGINMKFEIILGDIKQFISEPREGFSLERNIDMGFKILDRFNVEGDMVLEWLMCVNLCISKKFHRKLIIHKEERTFNWILEKYQYNLGIVLQLIEYMVKSESDEYIHLVCWLIQQWLGKRPKWALEVLESVKNILSVKQMNEMCIEFQKEFSHILKQDIESAVKLYRFFYTYSEHLNMESDLVYILENFKDFYEGSLRVLVILIKLTAQMGWMEECSELLEIGMEKIDVGLRKVRIELAEMIDLWEVILVMGGCEGYIHQLTHCLAKNIKRVVCLENKEILKRVFELILLSNKNCLEMEFLYYILRRYREIFNRVPKEAIFFLKKIKEEEWELEIKTALEYSKERFNLLIIDSVEAALELLIMCKEKELDVVWIVERCFDYILFNNTRVDILMLYQVLDDLDRGEMVSLKKYLDYRYVYIEQRFPELANKIKQIYKKYRI